MKNNTPTPGSLPIDNGRDPDNIALHRVQMELSLLKDDYKKLLGEYYQKKEFSAVQTLSIGALKSSIDTLTQSITTLTDKNNEMVNKQGGLDEDLADKEIIISEQNRKIHSLYQQIDVLNIKLSEIYASEGWKLLSVYYGIRNRLLPQNSLRYKKVKNIVNRIRGKKNDNIVIQDHSGPGGNPYERSASTQFDPFEFPYFSDPKVSVIIPAYNGWEMNYLCLRSIKENTESLSYEVIFADDASTDETRNIDQTITRIVHIRNEQNLGFLRNCNHAASFARGEYLHFLNNDTEVTPGWLSSLVTLMEKDKTIGMAGSKLVYPDGRLQEAGGIIWQDASGWNYGHKQDPEAPEFNYVKEVDYISGASIMIRTDLWKKLGGFDERYAPAYFEDTDLAFSVRKEGYKVVYQPLSVVRHFEGFSHGTDQTVQPGKPSIKSYQQVNALKFLEKWSVELDKQFPNAVNPFWTRDRSKDKKTIVVIDHYVPHFDKDAGSRNTFQLLRLFVQLGYNVKFIGDNFYKHEPYTTVLQQMGIEVLYGEYYRDNLSSWIEQNNKYIDFFYINRPHISIKYIDFIREKTNAKIVYFGHDLHFIRERHQYEIEKDPVLLASAEEWKKTETRLIRQSDTILTLSCDEKEIIEKEIGHSNVHTMPAFSYSRFNEPAADFDQRKDLLFVGGFGHKPNLDAVLWFTQQVFPTVRQELKDIRLVIVGSNAPEEVTRLASPSIEVRGYVSDEDLANLYRNVKMVVIPLRYGAGVKGKTVEAMYYGVPFVTTRFGIEGLQNINQVATGKDTAEQFVAEILELYNNNDKLQEFSRKEVEYARKYLSEENVNNIISEVFS